MLFSFSVLKRNEFCNCRWIQWFNEQVAIYLLSRDCSKPATICIDCCLMYCNRKCIVSSPDDCLCMMRASSNSAECTVIDMLWTPSYTSSQATAFPLI